MLTAIAVTGKFAGPPSSYELSWHLSAAMFDTAGHQIIGTKPIPVILDNTGSFSSNLWANDDATTQPSGTSWTISGIIDGTTFTETYVLNHTMAPTVDISTLSPAAVLNPVFPTNAVQLQGRAIATTAPADGQALVWKAVNADWEPASMEHAAWSQPSPLGSSRRAATDLFMSTYDTNPATADHTAAFQNALAAASALVAGGVAKVRIILDSRQKYTIGGAVQAGANGQFAQVPLPFHDDTATGTIELVGIPRGNDYSYISAGQSGTVIESTLSAAPAFSGANGIASVFGGPASFRAAPGSYPTEFSYLKFACQDVTIRSANPVVAGIDAGWLTGFSWQGLLQFDTDFLAANGIGYAGLTPCTNPQAIPIILPFNLDWFGTVGDHLVVAGWAHGPYLGEYLRCRSITVFGVPGAALLLDASNQASRIDYLTDWDNAFGIATLDGTFAGVTPVSPGSSLQAGVAPGSRRALSTSLYASPVEIGSWEMQTSVAGDGFPAALHRVNDILDQWALCVIDCPSFIATANNGTVNGGNLSVVGNGNSTTGYVIKIRCKNKMTSVGPNYFNSPASGVAARNPTGRDCLVWVESANGAAISAIAVNTAGAVTNATGTYPFMVPAQAIYAVTYAGGSAPTLTWQAI